MISEHNETLAGRLRAGSSRTGRGRGVRRAILLSLGAAAAAALVAACGGPGGIYGTSSGAAAGGSAGTAHHAPASPGAAISAHTLPGVGTVLVNRAGKTLYSPQQEAHGTIMCTGGCLNFWFPVPATAGATLHAPAGVTGALGTIHRPGGQAFSLLTYAEARPWAKAISEEVLERRMPPSSSVILMVRAPASTLFSRSSFRTEAGRSTTSPAAIWLTRSCGSTRMALTRRL